MDLEKIVSSVTSDNNNSVVSVFDRFLYFVEYIILIGACFATYSFLLFYLTRNAEALGIIVLVFWFFSASLFQFITTPLVYKDVKKLQAKGVRTNNTPAGWGSIVFFFPVAGLAIYLAFRRADYKKQLLGIANHNLNTQIN